MNQTIKILVQKEFEQELKTRLIENNIELIAEDNLLESSDFKSQEDILTAIGVLLGLNEILPSVASIIKEMLKKTKVEIEYWDEKEGKKYRVKCKPKEVDSILEKLKNSKLKEEANDNISEEEIE